MTDVAVVHLVRKANGVSPFERFVASYRVCPAGLAHELVILFKGFRQSAPVPQYESLLDGIAHERLFLPDRGYDLQPYFTAVRLYHRRHFCFLNSFSTILVPGWLEKLYRALRLPGVGIVGATGSYQSFARTHDERVVALRGRPPLSRLREQASHVVGDRRPAVMTQRAGAWLLGAVGLWKPSRYFPPFPNYHIRTNAFMASRETLQAVRAGPMLWKLSTFALESGRRSVTRQIMGMGLRALVVDRHGTAFEKEHWHAANTFRQSRQEDLLVQDNQTSAYAIAGAKERAALSRAAWGEYARPG